jgi:hypothetical protein
MLVELDRYQSDQSGDPIKIAVNPVFVSSVTASEEHDNCVVVKGPDGRGYLILGTYEQVKAKLDGRDDIAMESRS